MADEAIEGRVPVILVTGATGTVGTTLLAELVGRRAPVRALVHRRLPHARRDVETVTGAFDDIESLRGALDGVERVFLLSPAGTAAMVAQQRRVVDLAAEAGVAHVVKLSSIAADEDPDAAIIRAHRQIERHIEASGMHWTHLRPNWYMQNELSQADAIVRSGAFHAPDVTRITTIDARDVAAVAARVLTAPGHERRAYDLTGPEALSYADIAERWARVLGRPVRWVRVSLAEARQSMERSGIPADLARGYAEILGRYRDGGATARVAPDAGALLGRPPTSFEQFIEDHRPRKVTPC